MLRFGNTFRYNEKEYVYLAQNGDVLYSALILDTDQSGEFKRRCDKLCQGSGSPQIQKILDSKVYCFVELRTEEYKNRLAHFANTDTTTSSDCASLIPIGQLDEEDLKEIKKEIETGPVPLALKKLTEDINFA